jgi:hypothetical protein
VAFGAARSRGHFPYNFGTSTELKLRVVDEREGRIGNEQVCLLSQNEAPIWECEVCGEEASWICTFYMYERENPSIARITQRITTVKNRRCCFPW